MKTLKFLAVSLLFVSVAQASCESAQECATAPYTEAFAKGFAYGAGASLTVDALKKYSPSLDSLNLYTNYGICRDQLTGISKVSLALLASAYLGKVKNCAGNTGVFASKLAGIAAGYAAAAYASKVATAYFAAPATAAVEAAPAAPAAN